MPSSCAARLRPRRATYWQLRPIAAAALRRSAPGLAATFGYYLRDRRRRRPFRHPGERRERRQHRLLSGAADAGDAAPGNRVRRSVRAHSDAGAARAADRRRGGRLPRGRRRSPTARSRASASGAAISCSRRIPRSAARASSASGRSCATRTARLRRLTNAEIAKNPQYGDFSLEQSQARRRGLSTTEWMT